MIGLDTNIVVRILVRDDPEQLEKALLLLTARQDEPGAFYINQIVLVELVWVLRSQFGKSREEISQALLFILETAAFEIEEWEIVAVALEAYTASKADFADCLIAAKNLAAGCDHTLSFDSRAAKVAGVKSL